MQHKEVLYKLISYRREGRTQQGSEATLPYTVELNCFSRRKTKEFTKQVLRDTERGSTNC